MLFADYDPSEEGLGSLPGTFQALLSKVPTLLPAQFKPVSVSQAKAPVQGLAPLQRGAVPPGSASIKAVSRSNLITQGRSLVASSGVYRPPPASQAQNCLVNQYYDRATNRCVDDPKYLSKPAPKPFFQPSKPKCTSYQRWSPKEQQCVPWTLPAMNAPIAPQSSTGALPYQPTALIPGTTLDPDKKVDTPVSASQQNVAPVPGGSPVPVSSVPADVVSSASAPAPGQTAPAEATGWNRKILGPLTTKHLVFGGIVALAGLGAAAYAWK